MTLTDTHCHLDFDNFKKDREAVLGRAWEAGLDRLLIPGIDLTTSQRAVEIAEGDRRIFVAVGVHPNRANLWDRVTLNYLEAMARNPNVVAIGEIGLDYYRDSATPEQQREAFRSQVDLAVRLELPIVIHIRNASREDRSCFLDAMDVLKGISVRGVFHSFSGTLEEARQVLDSGFYIGITGPVTFKNAAELRMVVEAVPLDRLLIETDSPFLTPQPNRGKRNEPAYVRFVAQKISDVKNQSTQAIAEATTANAKRLFQWSV